VGELIFFFSKKDDEGIGHFMSNISKDMLIMTHLALDITYIDADKKLDLDPKDLELSEEMLAVRAKRTTDIIKKINIEAGEILKTKDIETIRKKLILYRVKANVQV